MSLVGCAALCPLLTGCGFSIGSNNICTTQTVVGDGKTAGSANVTVSAPGADFTIYPWQTTTVPVTVSGSGSGPVTLTVAGLPSGVLVQPVTATVGSTANLTFVSTPALAAECFRGTSLVYSAYWLPGSLSTRCLASPEGGPVPLSRIEHERPILQGVPLKTKKLERIVVIGADIRGPACEDQSTTGNLVRLPHLAVRMPAQKDVATLTDVVVDIRSIAVGMNLLRIEVLTRMIQQSNTWNVPLGPLVRRF